MLFSRHTTNKADNFTNDLLLEDYVRRFSSIFKINSALSTLGKFRGYDPKIADMGYKTSRKDHLVNANSKMFKRRHF